jgi:uncharacterized damage-inducible protein DinB
MPGLVPPVADERHGLVGYLGQQRNALRIAVYGLTDDQARERPTASALTLGGLVKHVTSVEQGWIDMIREALSGGGSGRAGGGSGGEDDYLLGFTMQAHETLDGLLAAYGDLATRTDALLADVDLDLAVPVPKGVPWFPSDVDAWSARWIVLHVIEETARHAGHADILRESVDGATAFPLMAAVEGWPETPWTKPWRKE